MNKNTTPASHWISRRIHEALLTVTLLCSTAYAGQGHKHSADLEGLDPESTVDVIVQFKETPTSRHHQKLANYGGMLKTQLNVVKAGHYSLKASEIEALAADSDVAFISPDRKLHGALDLTVAAVNAGAAANYSLDGAGIGIAILDSGVNGHIDLNKMGSGGSRLVYSQDFTGQGVTVDNYGHGTHVAGIAAGNGKAAQLYSAIRNLKGIASMANIVNFRVLDNNGEGKDSSVISAIQRAIALKSTYNIRVMNLSLGRPVSGSYLQDPLCLAVESAWKAGIVVVVAAGNQGRNNNGGVSGYGTIMAPGNDPYVITVGAMKTVNTPDRADDRIASYSSKGPTLYDHVVKPDILAPGNQVRSLLSSNTSTLFTRHPVTQVPVAYYATGYSTISAKYANLSGTSMATPVVSGAAALLIQQNPALTPDQVKARLMKTAYKSFPASSTAMDSFTGTSYNSYYDIFTVGAGYLDIAAALMNSDLASGNALSPVAVYNAATNTGTLSFAPSSTWSNSVIWGTGVTWGTNVMSGSSVIWGSSVSWGTSVIWGSTQGFSVLWGTGHCGSGIGIGMGFGNECIDPAGVIWGSNSAIQDMAVLTLGEN